MKDDMDLDQLSDEILRILERQYQQSANEFLTKANRCRSIRIRRSALVSIRESDRAIQRAKTGVCTKGIGDCPVHQMGSCKLAKVEIL